jgi:hypothetical protein
MQAGSTLAGAWSASQVSVALASKQHPPMPWHGLHESHGGSVNNLDEHCNHKEAVDHVD